MLVIGVLCFAGLQADAAAQLKAARFVPPPLKSDLFKVNAQLDRTGFRVGEPILVKIALRNVSNRDLLVMTSSPHEDYKIEVFQENGQLAPMTRVGKNATPGKRRRTWGGPHEKVVKPFEELRTEIDVTVLYDLVKPGTYTVVVSRETDEMAERPQLVAWFKAISDPMKFFVF